MKRVCVIFALAAACTVPPEKSGETVYIVRVEDGNTVVARFPNRDVEPVRLIGVHAVSASHAHAGEEMRPCERCDAGMCGKCVGFCEDMRRTGLTLERAKEFSGKATARVRELLAPSSAVRVERGKLEREAGRPEGVLLGYVFLKNGRMLNLILVEEGLADTALTLMRQTMNDAHLKQFEAAQARARATRAGLWEDR